MAKAKKLSEKEVFEEKQSKLMRGVGKWTSYYRANPQRFVKDYLNINLKLFQKILLYEMMLNNYFMYLAARGQGKTYLVALFCVVRCILYPGSKIVIASATRGQANEVLAKIHDDFCRNYSWGSNNLNSEIDQKNFTVNQNKAECYFRNGSYIKVVAASDNARHARANIVVIDEFRMVDLDIINTVLRRFLTAPRHPQYLDKPKYKNYPLERNKEVYLSSAWYQSHWSYEKAKAYFVNMLDDTKKYFICALPYQISIKEGLLMKEQVEDEMSEADFDPIKFSMEMECLFYGDTDGAFFNYDDISKCRKIKTSLYDPDIMTSKGIKVPPVACKERRIMSVDIALLSSKKHNNDASSIQINSAIQTISTSYIGNFIYFENHEGMTTDELGLRVMRLFYYFKCTDLAIDVRGLGIGVYDFIIKDQYDPSTGETYKAMTISDKQLKFAKNKASIIEYADRCKVKDASKVIWAMLGSPSFNSDTCINLRNGIQNSKINLLISEFEAEEVLRSNIKGYIKMTPSEQLMYKASFIQTSAAINELVGLEHTVNGTEVRVHEQSGARKDRFSSMSYNYFVQSQLELLLKPQKSEQEIENTIANRLPIKRSKFHTLFD